MSEIVLRDLQPLLRLKLGNDLIVEKFTTSSLVPTGENYGSTILKVCALIKRSENEKPEELHLIAKMLPMTEFQRKVFDVDYTIRKEVFLYEELFPSYQKLEMEFGVEKNAVFNILPEYYGSRLTLKPEIDAVVDEDAVILLENLKERGFYTADRKIGLDLEHSKVAVKALARFHTLGMVMKYKKPEYFEVLKFRSKCMNIGNAAEFGKVIENLLTYMREDSIVGKYYDRCSAAISNSMDMWTKPPEEPWSTIVHSDFWVNNFLFHQNSNGEVDDIKFVDFQNYLFLSPLRELAFFLAVSVKENVIDSHWDKLIELYYDVFISHMKNMQCDITPFSKDSFQNQLVKDSAMEFGHCCFMLKVLTLDIKEDNMEDQGVENIMLSKGSDYYYERLRNLIIRWTDKGWL